MAKKLTRKKAKKMLEEGVARGKKITPRQRRFFGLIAGGGKSTRLKKKKK